MEASTSKRQECGTSSQMLNERLDTISHIERHSSQEDQPTEEEGGTFLCSQCSLEEHYHYKGTKPPFSKHVKFLDPSYVMRDPFSPPSKHQYLLLGSDCFVCHKPVCQAPECSLFYSKRFCRMCAEDNIDRFPSPVQGKIKRFPSNNPK